MSLAHQQKLLAELRQRRLGVWIGEFVVIGYDDEFRMYAPGDWHEKVAELRLRLALMKALRVRLHFIITKSMTMETP